MHILKYPHPTLRHVSKPLRRVDAELRSMVRQMIDLMYEQDGVGLAANQVDLPYRLFVMNLQADSGEREEHVLINPVIVRRKGSAEDREGCLSLPGIYAPVIRSETVEVNAFDLSGQELTYQLEGLAARTAQHEIDHLDGVLFIDRLSPASKLAVKEALEELELEFQGGRRRGVIPDDTLISARLAELEAART